MNLAFRDPLVPDRPPAPDGAYAGRGRWRLDGRPGGAPWVTFGGARTVAPLEVPWTERGLIVCGDGAEDPESLREMAEAAGWLEGYRQFWEARFNRLDSLLERMKAQEKKRHRAKR